MNRFLSSQFLYVTLLVSSWTIAPSFAQLVPVTSKRQVTWSKTDLPIRATLESIHVNPQEEMSVGRLPAPNMDVVKLGASRSNGRLPAPINPVKQLPGSAGNQEVINQRYPDGKIQIKRQVMQDVDGNYLNHGPWKLYNRRGQVMAEGEFQEGLMQGNWQRWHPAGSQGLFQETPFSQFQGPFLSVVTFDKGQLNGVWTIYDQVRRKIQEIPYTNGKRDGRAIWYWPHSGVMREVDFREGQIHGQLNEYDRQNKPTRQANFDEGQELVTRSSWFHKKQLRSKTSFLGPAMNVMGEDDWWNAKLAPYGPNGTELQHGATSEWYSNGQISLRGQFENDVRVGPFVWWHENGQKQISGSFANGLKSGPWIWWHPNGRKAIEGVYESDSPAGQWTWWNENGTVDGQRNFSEEINLDVDGFESIQPDEGATGDNTT